MAATSSTADGAAELCAWLESRALSDLAPALRGATLDGLGDDLLADRAAFLAGLKRRGIDVLPQRQALANALGRWAKALPLLVRVDCGLCNRLRAALSHRLVATEGGRPLTIAWTPCDECPGRFLECFAPLPGMEVVDELDARVARPLQFRSGMLANSFCAGVKGVAARETECYRGLEPTAAVRAEVARTVAGRTGRTQWTTSRARPSSATAAVQPEARTLGAARFIGAVATHYPPSARSIGLLEVRHARHAHDHRVRPVQDGPGQGQVRQVQGQRRQVGRAHVLQLRPEEVRLLRLSWG